MSFMDLVRKRCSVRAYLDKPVSRDAIIQVLEAGRLAPSACNFQPWHFVVAADPQSVALIKEAYKRDWFLAAPLSAIIAVCLDKERCWKRKDGRNYGDVDVAIAVDHMTLQAADLGLGTCWIGAFDPAQARAALKLPDHLEPLVLTPLGYPASQPPAKTRKALEEVVSWGVYGGR